MRYKVLGKTGVRLSEVALGTMTFGDDWGWGAPPEVSAKMFDLFAEAGGNVIDTADVYTNGTSEALLGELLKGRRDRFVLGTKFTNQTDLSDPNSAGNHRKKIIASLEASLRRLQTDRIDLYWVHARDLLTGTEELMRALDDQVRLGKILYPAVSDWSAWEIAESNTAARLHDWSPFAAVQLRYNLLDRSPERELLPMADAFDLPVFAWGPLAEGRITGKYLSGETGRVTEAARRYTRVGSDDIVREVVAVSEEIGASAAQVAISWVRQQPGPIIPLLAARTEDQFRDNLGAIDVQLSCEHVDRLDALSRPALGFPADVMGEASVVAGVYGTQLADIDEPRAEAVRRHTTGI
ncbi:MAG: putative oxidoreductase, aryl-alcohol dehydrogenase like protein [Acidimicrobiaceae bacterium]|nr:putative oxidoreductase, aryl-alcohol dehydrogenase like protein [Acidimicrobiaceae bacterium]